MVLALVAVMSLTACHDDVTKSSLPAGVNTKVVIGTDQPVYYCRTYSVDTVTTKTADNSVISTYHLYMYDVYYVQDLFGTRSLVYDGATKDIRLPVFITATAEKNLE